MEGELAQNTWIVSDINEEQLFDQNEQQFWRQVLKRMGGDFKVLSNYPIDPRLN